jgi:hypothetical protein
MSRDVGWAVYLVDPGPNRPAILALLGEVLALRPEDAAEYLRDFPSLISFFDTEATARTLAGRFRDLEAVAVVRRGDSPLAPAPVEAVDALPAQRVVRKALLVLGVMQIGVSILWLQEGRVAAAVFGFLLAIYVLIYFGRARARS